MIKLLKEILKLSEFDGNSCTDIVPIAKQLLALLKSEQSENERLKAEIDNVREALLVLNRLRLLYNLSSNMHAEPTQSAAKLMIKQSEEGIRLAQARRQQEYIDQLRAELVETEEALTDSVKLFALEVEKHRWIPVSERLPEKGEPVLLLANDKMGVPLPKIIYGKWTENSKPEMFTHWKPVFLPEKD